MQDLVGRSGWLRLRRLTVTALEQEDHLLCAGICEKFSTLHPDACERLFQVAGRVEDATHPPQDAEEALHRRLNQLKSEALTGIAQRNNRFFDEEITKLERWADDLKHGLEMELKDLDARIKQTDKEAKLAADLESKLALHRTKKELESERSKKRRALYEAQDDIDARKEELIASVEARLHQNVATCDMFTICWSVV